VLRFALAGFVAMLLVCAVTAWVSLRVGTQRAVEDARSLTRVVAQGIVAPTLHDGLIRSDASELRATDDVVRSRVLDDSLVRVKIWTTDGTVIYSDEPGLIGERFVLSGEQRAAFSSGASQAGLSPLSAAENRFDVGSDLLEVYQPIETVEGTPLLFEAYFRHDDITDLGRRLWWQFVPLMIIALLALELVQLPLAWRMAKRLRADQEERERLLRLAIDASELERRRLAVDLHHGVVQDLSAISFSLAAQGRRSSADPAAAAEAAESIRTSITSLRSLFGEIPPREVTEDGLEFAIRDLMAGLPGRGVETALEVRLAGSYVDDDSAALAYRVVQEALRNAVGQAHATTVKVALSASDGQMNVVVDDNGHGGELGRVDDRVDDGRAVLEMLADRLAEAGGSLGVLIDPDSGTRVVARLRLATADDPF
jgi:signal transduction histidine kinase